MPSLDSLVGSVLGDGPPANTGQDQKDALEQHWKVNAQTEAVTLHDQPFNETFVEPKADAITHPYNEPITVPKYRAAPMTCGDKCAEQDRLARQHCDMIRKRVAQWMKDSGCPSSIRGFKMKNKCGGRGKSKSVSFYDVDGDGKISAKDFSDPAAADAAIRLIQRTTRGANFRTMMNLNTLNSYNDMMESDSTLGSES